MRCDEVRERLNEYVDGEMGVRAVLGVRGHVLVCGACRAQLRETQRMTGRLVGLATEEEAVRVKAGSVRRTRLAVGLAIVVVLLLPAGLALWVRHGTVQGAAAAGDGRWTVTAKTPEGKGIWSVHFVATSSMGEEDGRASLGNDVDVKIEYPDKMKTEPQRQAGTVIVRNGDRQLADLSRGPGLVATDGRLYRCVEERPTGPLPSPDTFAEAGVIEAGVISLGDGSEYGLGPMGAAMYPNSKELFARTEETGPNGERVLVIRHTKVDVPSFEGLYRIRIDPATHLVLGWVTRVKSGFPKGSPREGQVQEYRGIVEHVEYNVLFPSDTFRVQPPAGVAASDVLDQYSPEALKKMYEDSLDLWERDAKTGSGATLALAERVHAVRFPRLDVLRPEDQQEIRARAKRLGITIP